jgi:predicted PurR-regulated permease PerM
LVDGMKNFDKPISRDFIETMLVVLFFIALLYALYNVLEVFFGVLTFALVFSVSFSKPYEWLVQKLRGKRKTSAVIYAVVLVAIVALPITFLIAAMSRHIKQLIVWLAVVRAQGLPPLPDYVLKLPVVGPEIGSFWTSLRDSPKEMIHLHQQQINLILHHFVTAGMGILGVALQFVLGIIISGFLLERGDNILNPIKSTFKHLISESDGVSLMQAITQAVRGVSIGVMGTGFIASFVAWTGLMFAGIPFATGIAAIIFFLVVIQIGPLVIWIPLIIWEAIQGNHSVTIILSIYLVIIVIIDVVIKPVLIARSGKLPFLVLFLGVIGGLAAWGFTGMFKGAIITAIFYTIFNSWLERKNIASEIVIVPSPNQNDHE